MDEAFDSDFALHHAALVKLARRLAMDEADAQDLAQDAWTTLLRRGGGTVRDVGAFLSGVVRVRARRNRADAAARRVREQRSARDEAVPGPVELLARLELARVLADELRALPENQRTLLLLRHQEGLSPAAIAKHRGVPVGTVRAQLSRARDALREQLDRRHGGRREAWALTALAPVATQSAPVSGGLIGAFAMHTAAKWSVGLAAVLLVGWAGKEAFELAVPAESSVVLDADSAIAATSSDSTVNGSPAAAAPVTDARTALVPRSHVQTPATEVAPGSLDLLVMDARTGEPLPHYAVELEQAGGADLQLVTDALGRAKIPGETRVLGYTLRAFDDAEDGVDKPLVRKVAAWSPEDDEAQELRLDVFCGPTYELVLPQDAPALEDLEVCLTTGSMPDVERASDGRVRPASTPLGRPWVRLDPEHAGLWLGESGPWTLTVRDRRGTWIAHGPVERIVGRQGTPVVLESDVRGTLVVSVTVDGAAPTSAQSVSVVPFEADKPRWDRARHLYLQPPGGPFPSTGRARFGHLAPGAYRVVVGNQDLERAAHDIEVTAGGVEHLTVDLQGRADLAPLVVVARRQSGRPNGPLTITAHRDGELFLRFSTFSKFHVDGASEYRFDALPLGEWEVRLEPTPHLPPWREMSVRARPGGAPVELLCLDADTPPETYGVVRIVDASTNAPIAFAGVMCYVGKRRIGFASSDQDGVVHMGPFLPGAPVGLMVRAEDGRGRLVELEWPSDPEPEVLEIALRPGWCTLIEVAQPDPRGPSGKPLAGVRVRVDERDYGFTDRHGQLSVELPAKPKSVRFEMAGFRMQHSGFDEETGALGEQSTHPHWVVLEPDR